MFFSLSILISLSPPIPTEWVRRDRIRVWNGPSLMPDGLKRGIPSRTTDISVVVPPTSSTRVVPVQQPSRARAPMTPAAGPDWAMEAGEASLSSRMTVPPSGFRRYLGEKRDFSFSIRVRASVKFLCTLYERGIEIGGCDPPWKVERSGNLVPLGDMREQVFKPARPPEVRGQGCEPKICPQLPPG